MIIDGYLCRTVLRTFAATLIVLLLVYGSNRFARFIGDVATGVIAPDLVFQLLVLKLVESLSILVPLSLYIAVLIGVGRLYRDSEIAALGAGGIGLWRISRGVFWVVLGLSIAGAGLSMFVSPGVASMQRTLYEQARQHAKTRVFTPGRFKKFGKGDQTIYVEAIDPETERMSNVFVRVRKPHREYVLVSREAYQTVQPDDGGRMMILEDGHRYAGTPGDAMFSVTQFERHGVRIDEGSQDYVIRKLKMLPTMKLIGSGKAAHTAELQNRISTAVSIVLLGMLAVPLARIAPRKGHYAQLGGAVVVYFIYYNLISIFVDLLKRGVVPDFIGVWPVHVAVGIVILVLMFSQSAIHRRFGAKLRAFWRKPGMDRAP